MPCSYCSEFSGKVDDSYYYQHVAKNKSKKRIKLESKSFYIFPSIGSLVTGHMLVVPKRHITALCMLDEDTLSELTEVIKEIQEIYKEILHSKGEHFIFEHGIIDTETSTMNCVDHAHLHIIPTPIDLDSLSLTKTISISLDKLHTFTEKTADYIFFGELSSSFISLDKDKHPQYLRKQVHEILNLPGHWNWRADHQNENINKWLSMLDNFINHRTAPTLELKQLKIHK